MMAVRWPGRNYGKVMCFLARLLGNRMAHLGPKRRFSEEALMNGILSTTKASSELKRLEVLSATTCNEPILYQQVRLTWHAWQETLLD